ncbi:MAG: helix-turn-helix transcriptional regulator [Prevotellaceae bacterium]|jgi:AraC-like DNA-binding protein|nr:helix-turn-helix transcriptional regulator [Prevotellaceae bacterium]
MNKIPVHKASLLYPGEIAVLRGSRDIDRFPAVDYAHRDDYYVFIFLEKGYVKFMIDFAEYELADAAALCIQPGQVHLCLECTDICGWFLMVDAMFVNDEHKSVFEKLSFLKSKPELNDDNILDLKYCIAAMNRRLKNGERFAENSIVGSLLSAYIGMVAEIYRKGLPASANSRHGVITSQFKALLSANYKTVKSPSQYASLLNISPAYLNEAVKNTAGMSVSLCIRAEIVMQAKRLLFHTRMSVKEIALELGYDDCAYFIRLFTKTSSLSPVQFRQKAESGKRKEIP